MLQKRTFWKFSSQLSQINFRKVCSLMKADCQFHPIEWRLIQVHDVMIPSVINWNVFLELVDWSTRVTYFLFVILVGKLYLFLKLMQVVFIQYPITKAKSWAFFCFDFKCSGSLITIIGVASDWTKPFYVLIVYFLENTSYRKALNVFPSVSFLKLHTLSSLPRNCHHTRHESEVQHSTPSRENFSHRLHRPPYKLP